MVLVDSSVWIAYFKGAKNASPLNALIDVNNLCVNDLILAELLPAINHRKEKHLKTLLSSLTRIPLNIQWDKIIRMQTKNLAKGINKVGIADLVIAQNALTNGLALFTLDKHFYLMSEVHGLKLHQS